MSCDIHHSHGSDLALLWLWYRLAAVAPIQPLALAWELSYAATVAPKRKKKKAKKERKKVVLYICTYIKVVTDLSCHIVINVCYI